MGKSFLHESEGDLHVHWHKGERECGMYRQLEISRRAGQVSGVGEQLGGKARNIGSKFPAFGRAGLAS